MNTQAVVWENLMSLDLATGYLGSLHDSRVLRKKIAHIVPLIVFVLLISLAFVQIFSLVVT